jgi:hypothetical protein
VALFILLLAGTVPILDFKLVLGYVVLGLSYYGLLLFEYRQYKKNPRNSLEVYIAKQLAMLALVCSVVRLAAPFGAHAAFLNAGVQSLFLPFANVKQWWILHYQRALLVSLGYLFLIDGGTRIVRGILAKFPGVFDRAMASLGSKVRKNTRAEHIDTERENAGEWIGILERLVVLTFVFTDSFAAIAFALTAKSIARFKELENKDFAEYYLLGTSASVAIALMVGMIIRLVGGI